jgi:hypothetical protein
LPDGQSGESIWLDLLRASGPAASEFELNVTPNSAADSSRFHLPSRIAKNIPLRRSSKIESASISEFQKLT